MEKRNETLIVKKNDLQKWVNWGNNTETKSLEIRLTEKEYEKLVNEAKEFDISINQLVREKIYR